MAEVERRRDMRQRYEAQMAKHQAANPNPIAEQRLAELGGIAGVDSAMGGEAPPEDMAALQGGIAAPPQGAGGPPPGMGGPPPGMGGPPPGMAHGGLIRGYQAGDIVGDPDELEEPTVTGYTPWQESYQTTAAATEARQQEAAALMAEQGLNPGDSRWDRIMQEIAMSESGYIPERQSVLVSPPGLEGFEGSGGATKPLTRSASSLWEDYQEVREEMADDPRAYEYYANVRGVDVSSPEAFKETYYKTGFFGGRKPRYAAYETEEAEATLGALDPEALESTDVVAAERNRRIQEAADAMEARQDAIDAQRGVTGVGGSNVDKWFDRYDTYADEYLSKFQTPTQAEKDRLKLWEDETAREEELLARELGLSKERVAELRREMPTEEQTSSRRKSRLFSRLGAALMGSPRELGSALERTTSGLEDLDDKLRTERRRDLGEIYTQRAAGLGAERSGRLGIRGLKEKGFQDRISRSRAGESEVLAGRQGLIGQAMQAQGAYDANLLRIREALNMKQLELGQVDASDWAETEQFFIDALRSFGEGGEFEDAAKYEETLQDYQDTISSFGRGIAGNLRTINPDTGLLIEGATARANTGTDITASNRRVIG